MEEANDQAFLKSPIKNSQQTHLPEAPPPPTPADGAAKTAAPTRLAVPKAFKYPEMYTSPTDLIMSPVSKGILARTKSKKSSFPLPPSSTTNQQHKIEASNFQDLGALKI